MGEARTEALRVGFDRVLKLEFHGPQVTSDAGLLPDRDLDDALGLTAAAGGLLHNWRTGQNMRHTLTALLRQTVFSRLAGHEDTNDAERLSVDPTMRYVVGGRARDRQAASTSQMGRFETEVLTDRKNLKALMSLPGLWVDRVREQQPSAQIILDLDSSVSETYGEQEGSAYNGHFGCTCYHPLFCVNQFGNLERTLLRNGNVASADDWRSVLEPVVRRYRDGEIRRFFRGDAAFARPELYEFLEVEGYWYAIRLPANEVLQPEIEPFLTRPVGRPPFLLHGPAEIRRIPRASDDPAAQQLSRNQRAPVSNARQDGRSGYTRHYRCRTSIESGRPLGSAARRIRPALRGAVRRAARARGHRSGRDARRATCNKSLADALGG